MHWYYPPVFGIDLGLTLAEEFLEDFGLFIRYYVLLVLAFFFFYFFIFNTLRRWGGVSHKNDYDKTQHLSFKGTKTD